MHDGEPLLSPPCAGVMVPTEAIHPNHQSHTMIWTARLPPRFPFTMLRFTPSIPTPTECTCTDTEQQLQITADFDHWETGVTFKVTTQRKLSTSTSTSHTSKVTNHTCACCILLLQNSFSLGIINYLVDFPTACQ